MDELIRQYTENTIKEFLHYLICFEGKINGEFTSSLHVHGYDNYGNSKVLNQQELGQVAEKFVNNKCNIVYQKRD